MHSVVIHSQMRTEVITEIQVMIIIIIHFFHNLESLHVAGDHLCSWGVSVAPVNTNSAVRFICQSPCRVITAWIDSWSKWHVGISNIEALFRIIQLLIWFICFTALHITFWLECRNNFGAKTESAFTNITFTLWNKKHLIWLVWEWRVWMFPLLLNPPVCLLFCRSTYLPLLVPCPRLLLPSLYLRAPPSILQSTLSLIPLPRLASPMSPCTLLDTKTSWMIPPLLPLVPTLRKLFRPILLTPIPQHATTNHPLALMRTLLCLTLTDTAARPFI